MIRFVLMCGMASTFLLTGCKDKPEKDEYAQLEDMVIIEDQGAAKNIAENIVDQTPVPVIEDVQTE